MTFDEWYKSAKIFPPGTRAQMKMTFLESRALAIEECAKVCEGTDEDDGSPDTWDWHAKDYAKAIRALKRTNEVNG